MKSMKVFGDPSIDSGVSLVFDFAPKQVTVVEETKVVVTKETKVKVKKEKRKKVKTPE
jgi:hypothetical protein